MFEKTENGLKAFICRCGKKDAAAADELMREVCQRITAGRNNLYPWGVTSRNFITEIVTSLEDRFHAHISGIHAGQWFLVTAAGPELFQVTVQCDRVEDGFAAVWKAFADNSEAPSSNG